MQKQAYFPEKSMTGGPYSPALAVGELVFVAGQGPISPDTGEIIGESFEEQLNLTFDNISRALLAAGCTLNDCVKVNVYLSDMSRYAKLNEIYRTKFNEPLPARTTIQAVLWHHIQVEIDVIAMRGCSTRDA